MFFRGKKRSTDSVCDEDETLQDIDINFENEVDLNVEPVARPEDSVEDKDRNGIEYGKSTKKPWSWSKYEDGRHDRVRKLLKNYKKQQYKKKFSVQEQWGD
ncbi:MAG: hypothetical protein ABIH90_00195 [Candidatus Aenigmatarchaeota archaeon]